jgi:hypothetical protein
MSRKVPVNLLPEISVCWDMVHVRVISTADALCGSRAFLHNFQLFVVQRCKICRKFMLSLEFSERQFQRVDHLRCPQRLWWKIDFNALMLRSYGDCYQPRHGYCETSQCSPLWIQPHHLRGCQLKIVCLQGILQEVTGKTPPVHDGLEEWGVSLVGCVMVKMIVHENSPNDGNTNNFSSGSSSHTETGNLYLSSQYPNFQKIHPHLSRHGLLEICWLGVFCSFKWVLYPFKPVALV